VDLEINKRSDLDLEGLVHLQEMDSTPKELESEQENHLHKTKKIFKKVMFCLVILILASVLIMLIWWIFKYSLI
jgi:cell division protein FtsL